MNLHRAILLFSCALAANAASAARPDTASYPSMPIRVIVPTGSGGPSDLCMRAIAPAMQAVLGKALVVENITGATGNVGLNRVAGAAPDGYTVAVPSAGNTAGFAARPEISFDVQAGLKPVGKICNSALTLVVSPSLGIKSAQELVEYGKAHPGKLAFGSIGFGSSQHLVGEMFAAATGIKLQHIPFRGEAPAAMEIRAGRVQMMFMAGAKPFIDGHLVNGLATTNKTAWAPMPDLPSIGKSVVPGFSYNGWNGLMVPLGTPEAIVRKLSNALVEALKDPKVRATILSMGNVPGAGTPEELADQLRTDQAMFKQIIDERHLTFAE
ncbi:MAG TPA: tripartite tricarboxylate transporter substrate-binding protein [Herbaspirillum sp.]